ncbi:uncharacterized protein LOC109925297 isoform X2 [Rhincodon typus]|uniref:uncharacterized protein LOC109925297 isoform X2 n=1 Tax=Rhincodon typus TaxID=259920 RepID=UPI00202ECC05|nr:uncharacterized protein LOC109925297 isoform X2 [Rhincodon typus]
MRSCFFKFLPISLNSCLEDFNSLPPCITNHDVDWGTCIRVHMVESNRHSGMSCYRGVGLSQAAQNQAENIGASDPYEGGCTGLSGGSDDFGQQLFIILPFTPPLEPLCQVSKEKKFLQSENTEQRRVQEIVGTADAGESKTTRCRAG